LLILTPIVKLFFTFYIYELLIFDVILLLVVILKSFVVIFTKLLVVLRFKYVLLLPTLKFVTTYFRFVTVMSTLVLLINNLSLPLILNRCEVSALNVVVDRLFTSSVLSFFSVRYVLVGRPILSTL